MKKNIFFIFTALTYIGLLNSGNVTFQQGSGGGTVTIQSVQGSGSSGGSSTLAVGTGTASNFTTNVTSPTAAISFLGSQFNSLANGATNFITLNQSSVTVEGKLIAGSNITLTPGAGTLTIASSGGGGGGLPLTPGDTNYIQNRNTLQSGSTFYVSSGTVGGEFTVHSVPTSGGGSVVRHLDFVLQTNQSGPDSMIRHRSASGSNVDSLTFRATNDSDDGTERIEIVLNKDQTSGDGVGGEQANFRFKDLTGTHIYTSRPLDKIVSVLPHNFISTITLNGALLDGTSSAGSAGQVLKSNGSGTYPTWGDVSGGGSSVAIQDEGSYITTVGTINFVGAGVSAALVGTSSVTVTINGGVGSGGSSTLAIATGTSSGFTGLISSPTAIVNFSSTTFVGQLTGGATAYIDLSTHTLTLSHNFIISDDGDWSGEEYPIFEAPAGSSVSIRQINITSFGVGTSTIGVNFNERAFGTIGTSGSNVFSSTQQVTNVGARFTSFNDSILAPESYMVFTTTTNAKQGIVNAVKGIIHYIKVR